MNTITNSYKQPFDIEDFHELFIFKLRSRESSAPVKNQWNYSLQFLTELDIQREEVDEHVSLRSQKGTASSFWNLDSIGNQNYRNDGGSLQEIPRTYRL